MIERFRFEHPWGVLPAALDEALDGCGVLRFSQTG